MKLPSPSSQSAVTKRKRLWRAHFRCPHCLAAFRAGRGADGIPLLQAATVLRLNACDGFKAPGATSAASSDSELESGRKPYTPLRISEPSKATRFSGRPRQIGDGVLRRFFLCAVLDGLEPVAASPAPAAPPAAQGSQAGADELQGSQLAAAGPELHGSQTSAPSAQPEARAAEGPLAVDGVTGQGPTACSVLKARCTASKASRLPHCLSGCVRRAALRKAARISSTEAPGNTPRMWWHVAMSSV
mmetsp:Transcript_63247/g.120643  ORF Transcript_63247/g.120643 Transcript_63247/m.120643 type:complete len:245 (+) Transcript_63247:74-808(+)